MRDKLRHPFWQALLLLVLAYVLFKYGVAWLPPLIGIKSAPVPSTVVLQFMAIALVGILIYVSDSEERWDQFRQPIRAGMVDEDKKAVRLSLLVLLPLLVGFATWRGVRPSIEGPPQLRSIHPANPASITVHGKAYNLQGLVNPLRAQGDSMQHLDLGRRVYYRNCVFCHGDRFDGQGHYAHAFNPAPLSFVDNGTIAQLSEGYVFWRIAKGGRGLPREGAPWNSAMPAWEDFLTDEAMWAVTMYIYNHTGWKPRVMEEAGEGGAAPRPPQPPAAPAGGDAPGRGVYTKWCAGCHGDDGKGAGPGAEHLLPKPRDFTRALYQVRTTATGEVPTDADIRHVIDEGMPGTSMPAWKDNLSGAEREALVGYVKSFSAAFANPPTPLTFGRNPGGGQGAIDSGRALFRRIECWKCHGDAGRGDGRSAPTLKDDFGNPIRAADLTQNWMFNGGGSVDDIYRRLRTGLDGTPMPAFGDLIEANVLTEDDLWRIAAYVRSLSPEEQPRVRDVVNAARIDGALPAGPADSAWAGVERFYFPLVGQVILKPREFAPTVSGIWVQAVHNGSDLALRVTWNDPSQSPDSLWKLWRGRMARFIASDDSSARDTSSALPDRVAIQFATRLTNAMDRPYFLMGSAEEPVYLWRWESEPGAATEALARGPDQVEPLPPADDSVAATGAWDHGEWRVQFTRKLLTGDSTSRIPLLPGRPIPMALFAWDGSNGETGTRMAVGSWVSIYLGEPGRAGTYIWPLLAMVTTGGLGMVAVARAQRTSGSKSSDTQEDT